MRIRSSDLPVNYSDGKRWNVLEIAGEFKSRIEAEIAQGLLREQGIESIVKADDLGGMLMGVTLIRKGGIKLMVSSPDLERAQEILTVLEESPESQPE